MKSKITIAIKRVSKLEPPLDLPQYGSTHASGMDLMADIDEPIIIKPGQRTLIPTGLVFSIPEGYEAQIRPRSGLALKKGLGLVNSPGTIDADYRGEVAIIVINWGEAPILIERGERIAQMVITPVTKAELTLVDEIDPTPRADGGFGSTGS